MTGLLLHSVDVKPKFNMSSYSKDKFGAILEQLIRDDIKTTTVSQHISIQHISAQDPSAQISTAITFDDGLTSFYDNAWPLLEDKKIKSTIFPVAGLIGKDGHWDVMGRTSHMTAPMLREIAASGHEIGSHSLTHANLVWLGDDELTKELRDSKSILEDITGTAVKSLSFPFGSWNARVWDMAKSVGYEFATAYRGHRRISTEILPVMGVYRFDEVDDIVGRISPSSSPLSSPASKILARMMSHFSKGTPIVKFRKEYVRFPG
ncbi:MAG: polysaccharide deacetylase family protein [Chitinispirillia bacterium]|nr:polysaccharide deacetylase family protein [Chitinispirillia bacterium]MCL2242233.1 polysaccharide deacetylase family protein [Chitinispirillia bacterium]